jgi:hypothetical protein
MDTKELVEKLERVAWHVERWKAIKGASTEADEEMLAAGRALVREVGDEAKAVVAAFVSAGLLDVAVFDDPDPNPEGLHLRHRLLGLARTRLVADWPVEVVYPGVMITLAVYLWELRRPEEKGGEP